MLAGCLIFLIATYFVYPLVWMIRTIVKHGRPEDENIWRFRIYVYWQRAIVWFANTFLNCQIPAARRLSSGFPKPN